MDITGIASVATDMQASRLAQEVQVTVLKKALDAQASTAAQLIAALPQVPAAPSSANLPPNLGRNVNTTA